MNTALYLKSLLVNSSFEGLGKLAQRTLALPFRISHPEMEEVFLEETRLPEILSRLLTPSSNAIDVGCHIGSFLSRLIRHAPHGQHMAIEASPMKAVWLKKRFPGIRIEQVAISDRPGMAIFEENIDKPGFSKLAGSLAWHGRARRYEVAVSTLDNLNPSQSFDLVKIDIEGAELAAFKGGRSFFERNKPAIIFECGAQGEADLDRGALYDHVTSQMGYQVFTFADFLYNKGPLGSDEFRKCGIYPFRAFNYIAVPSRS